MGKRYKVRFINEPLRAYYRDQSNATTCKKRKHSRENIYLWKHYVNDILDYFWYTQKLFLKAFIGLSMDGYLLKMSTKKILSLPNGVLRKMLVLLCMPVGYVLYLQRCNLI